MQLPDNFHKIVTEFYLPLSQIIVDRVVSRKKDQPLLVSINGAQGTGKSTMTAFLKRIIESEMKCHVANLSLDDFYSKREERKRLAEKVHPLFVTRGVPGTHDVDLIERVLDKLIDRQPCTAPKFNKAIDERYDESEWTQYRDPVEVILFEGWCNNSPAQSQAALEQPVNALERNEDPQGIWRQYVNEQLLEYQHRLFSRTELCIMLKVDDFECVYDWRSLQEQKLKASSNRLERNRVMSKTELERFMQHFERISRHTLSHLPAMADVVLPVAADHSITAIVQK
ncbi:MAG: phosphoribulokinase [Gammaproteobacteria bacterium]|nr:phosphoribulokinase [Gammaproteobacteria bacterium]